MKYIMFHNQYYTVAKDSNARIILTPARGNDVVKAWARTTLKSLEERGYLRNVKFLRKGDRVFCLYLPDDDSVGFNGTKWGVAICGVHDEFNYEVGKAISFYRMTGDEIPEFVYGEQWEI